MPIITYNGMENTTRGRFDGFEVKGVKEKDGKEWGTFLFADIKGKGGSRVKNPMVAKLEQTPVGSRVNVIMEENKKNGKSYWNCVDIEVMAHGDGQPVKGTPQQAPRPASTGGGGYKSKGNFRDPANIDRSSAAYLGWDLCEAMIEKGLLGKQPKEDLIISKFQDLTVMVHRYITTGEGFEDLMAAPAETPQNVGGDDEPAPAPDEDEDIPF
jgi:hypothetical protein